MELVTVDDIRELLEHFTRGTFRAKESDRMANTFHERCHDLFQKDYSVLMLYNSQGELCTSYPAVIIIPEKETCTFKEDSFEEAEDISRSFPDKVSDAMQLRELIGKARFARCRTRFPVPTIIYEGKYVCRSATLSGGAEIYGRLGINMLFQGNSNSEAEIKNDIDEDLAAQSTSDWQQFSKVRSQDIKLLRVFDVSYICDFMVEKKKVKFGMYVTSSEKVDKENRYSDFTLLSLPYPGCEFFKDFSNCQYSAEGLMFDWNQSFVDAHLVVPNDLISSQLDVDWKYYKSWDVVLLTQNYLKLILKYLTEGKSGLLIHCISGWDRTPLFISLLRLSLWADGKAHQSLSATEIIFLTLCYDWYLFGHHLEDRLNKGEEILFFCFYMLKHISSDKFSVHKKEKRKHKHSLDLHELHFEHLILDEDCYCHCRGSNTSLSSTGSSFSSKSHDEPPTVFHTRIQDSDEGGAVNNGNGISSNFGPCYWHSSANSYLNSDSGANTPPTLTNSSESVTPTSHSNPILGSTLVNTLDNVYKTSPVAVPLNSRQRSESSGSSACGSWQIISGTGSVRGSTGSSSTRESLNSPTMDMRKTILKDSFHETSSHNSHSFLYTQRRDRLNSVRTIFYNIYSVTCGSKSSSDFKGFSTFLDHIVEKVGIKSSRSSLSSSASAVI